VAAAGAAFGGSGEEGGRFTNPGAGAAGEGAHQPAVVSQVVDVDGATLSADGVQVVIAGGAIAEPEELTLTVSDDALVLVTPDVYFSPDHPAKIIVDGKRWPMKGPRIAQHEVAGEFYMLDVATENPDGSWQYETPGFSHNRAGLATVVTPTDMPLPAADASDDYVEGDCSYSIYETSRTKQPAAVLSTDVNKCCLEDASDQVEDRHDNVTGVHAPPPSGDGVRGADEYNWMTREAHAGLTAARTKIKAALANYDLWINGAWDSSGNGTHAKNSNHNFGAALDLTLCQLPCKSAASKVNTPALLGKVPALLLASGFTWVWYEDSAHLHASISSPSLADCKPSLDINGTYASAPAPGGINPICQDDSSDPCFCNYDGADCNDGIFRRVTITVSGTATQPQFNFQQCGGYFIGEGACRVGNTIRGKIGAAYGLAGGTFEANFTGGGVSGSYHSEGLCGAANGANFSVKKQ
jgi:hypothetical protein